MSVVGNPLAPRFERIKYVIMGNRFEGPSQKQGDGEDSFEDVADQWSLEEAINEDDHKEFFVLFHKVHGMTDSLELRIQNAIKYYDRMPKAIFKNGERRQFVIRNRDQQVVAGAELIIGEKNGKKEAYFGHKVVDEKHRGQNLGRMLVEKRLQLAQESGCVEAWSLVEQNNIGALRSINKDGFSIMGNGFVKTGNNVSRDTYYVSRDLTTDLPSLLPIDEIEQMEPVQVREQFVGERILVPLDNKELIQSAFENGYIGIQVVIPKDSLRIQKSMLVMQRMSHDVQDKGENVL